MSARFPARVLRRGGPSNRLRATAYHGCVMLRLEWKDPYEGWVTHHAISLTPGNLAALQKLMQRKRRRRRD